MSSNFKYTAGLRNVGSYQVAGKPFVTGSVGLLLGNEEKIQFPSVTKEVTIRLPSPPNTAYKLEEDNGFFFACNQAGSGPFDLGGTGKPFSVSVWISASAPSTTNDAILSFFKAGSKKATFKIRGSGTRFQDNHGTPSMTNLDSGGSSIVDAGWKNFIIVQSGNASTHVYENGVHKNEVGDILARHFDDIYIPANSAAAMHGGYDQLTVWNVGLTAEEVDQLYNNGEYFDPTVHPRAPSLQAWYTFGDDPGDTIGASSVVQDASSNNNDTNMNAFGGSDELTVVNGPFSSTSGQLRIHLLSTASTSGGNIFANKHFMELNGYDQSLTLPMKTKEIYLTPNNRTMQYELYASLTSIPTVRMYALTGSGIDE